MLMFFTVHVITVFIVTNVIVMFWIITYFFFTIGFKTFIIVFVHFLSPEIKKLKTYYSSTCSIPIFNISITCLSANEYLACLPSLVYLTKFLLLNVLS